MAHPLQDGAPFFLPERVSPATPPLRPYHGVQDRAGRGVARSPDRLHAVGVAVAVAPVHKHTNNVYRPVSTATPKGRRKGVKRLLRYGLRKGLQRVSDNKRFLGCGRVRLRDYVGVVVGPEGTAHFSGVMSCGSVWLCPVCSAKIDARRAEEVAGVLKAHLAAGGAAYFGGLTMPHDFGDRLEPMRRLNTEAYRRLLQGPVWLNLKKRLGIVGYIRSLEVLHGANGWHPHTHPLFLTDRLLTAEELAELQAYVFRVWRSAIVKAGYRTPERVGFSLELVASPESIGAYMSKMGLALELTHGATKDGGALRTPFNIAEDFLATGDYADQVLWLEYEKAMHGARRLTWSKGLKARYAVAELSDEELATEEVGGELVATLSPDDWRAVVAADASIAILEAAESDGAAGVLAVLATLPSVGLPRWLRAGDGGGG
jgi:hypothetical protein